MTIPDVSELADEWERNGEYGHPMVCFCGLPMSRNPHPNAGDPTMEGAPKIGAVWECIPCLVRTRNSANHRWSLAQLEIDRLRRVIVDSLCSCSRSRAENEPHHPRCRALLVLKPQKGRAESDDQERH